MCPQECYDTMLDCWHEDQAQRPLFLEMVQSLAELFLSLKPQDNLLSEKLQAHKQEIVNPELNHYVAMEDEDEVCARVWRSRIIVIKPIYKSI